MIQPSAEPPANDPLALLPSVLLSADHGRSRTLLRPRPRSLTTEPRSLQRLIRAARDGELVAEHPRSLGRDRTIYDPWHYLPLLARKPRALRNGAPFQDWSLPPALTRLRKKLGAGAEGDRRSVRVLAAVLDDGLETVDEEMREALDAGVSSDDFILHIVARRREPPKAPGITTSEALQLRYRPIADCARCDRRRLSHAAA